VSAPALRGRRDQQPDALGIQHPAAGRLAPRAGHRRREEPRQIFGVGVEPPRALLNELVVGQGLAVRAVLRRAILLVSRGLLQDFGPSRARIEMSDIETIVAKFRQFLEAAGDRGGKSESIILEIK